MVLIRLVTSHRYWSRACLTVFLSLQTSDGSPALASLLPRPPLRLRIPPAPAALPSAPNPSPSRATTEFATAPTTAVTSLPSPPRPPSSHPSPRPPLSPPRPTSQTLDAFNPHPSRPQRRSPICTVSLRLDGSRHMQGRSDQGRPPGCDGLRGIHLRGVERRRGSLGRLGGAECECSRVLAAFLGDAGGDKEAVRGAGRLRQG